MSQQPHGLDKCLGDQNAVEWIAMERRVDGHIGTIRATGLPLRDFSLLLGSGNLIRRSRFLGQLLQQCLGLPQVFRVEALGEPAVDLRELHAGFLLLALPHA
jgi:hypothetical protein